MRRAVQILSSYVLWSAVACSNAAPAADGKCSADTEGTLQCGKDYTGHLCTGSARPDDAPRYVEGVPQGIVCADSGPRKAEGMQGYCCTKRSTACAYDPVAICDEGFYGFEYRGANRPDTLHAALSCRNGVRRGKLIDYCCTGTEQAPGCLQTDSVKCSTRLMGFSCKGGSLPRGEQLGANKSRTDLYRLLCSSPEPAPNPEYK